MATGAFYIAYDYEFYVKLGTTASTAPTSTTGMTRVFGLSNASISGTSETTSAVDYETGVGGRRDLVTNVGYSLPAQMNITLDDPGYHILQRAWLQGASGTALEWYRITPVKDGTTDDSETYAGVALVSGFDKDEAAGNVATVSFTMAGYGLPVWRPQGRGAATFTITSAGSGLVDAVYDEVALIGNDNDNGVGTGATADITVSGNVVTVAALGDEAGTNYNVGDVLTVAIGDIGSAGTPPVLTVATVAA